MGFRKLERGIQRFFHSYGRLVSRQPWPFLLTPLAITAVLAFGFLFCRAETDIVALFTLPNAPSRREVATMRHFSRTGAADWGDKVSGDENSDLAIFSKKSSDSQKQQEFRFFDIYVSNPYEANLLDPRVFDEIVDILRYVYTNFSCEIFEKDEKTVKSKKYNYSPDFCSSDNGCPRMDNVLQTLGKFLSPAYKNNSNVRLTYPALSIYGNSVVWADLIRGVTLRPDNTVVDFKLLTVPLQFRVDPLTVPKDHVHQCMGQLANFFWNLHRPAFSLEFHAMYEQLFVEEIQKTQRYSLPWIGLTVVLIASFCILSTFEGCHFSGTQAMEAGVGLLTVGLSLVAGFGLLFFAQQSYNFIVSTTPFVVLCVSIDNDFLLMAAWRRTNPNWPRDQRLSETFFEAGPSLTITSLTDILCFAIGCVSGVPAVSTFCLFTAVALSFRFVFQFTFFAAIMALGSERGVLCRTKCCCGIRKAAKTGQTREVDVLQYSEHFMHKFFRVFWTATLMRRTVRLFLLIFYFFYAIFSLFLVSRMVVNITPSRIVAEDSKMVPVFNYKDKYAKTSCIIGHVFVMKSPDFRNRSNRILIGRLVDQLQNSKYYTPSTSYTSMWFFDYLGFYSYVSESYFPNDDVIDEKNDKISADKKIGENSGEKSQSHVDWSKTGGDQRFDTDFYDFFGDFLKVNQYKKYAADIHWKKSILAPNSSNLQEKYFAPNIDSFQFRMYFRNVSTWDEHVEMMLDWRKSCALFPELDAMVVDRNNLNPYMDERMTVSPTTMQTTGIALLCMTLVTGLLMPDVTGIFYITLSFLSVDVGVVGLLNLWGCDLDLTTMAGILMTIGFSVYYTARICYSYQACGNRGENAVDDPGAKLAATLGAVGWPILQGGIGTILGIMPLSFVHCYVTRTFFKTIVLVVVCGLFHGLIFMPLMMTSLDSNKKKRFQYKINYS